MQFLFLCALLFLGTLRAQPTKDGWHWAFSARCDLDFSNGVPVSKVDDSLQVVEGSASISDINTGKLLFYTDGTKAWDRNSHRMLNGYGMIGGYGSSTQAALIIPKPGSTTLYYLISSDQGGYEAPNTGVHYSIVDMSLNSGFGDITIKNILLTPPPTTEKLTGVRHCNGTDYWVLTHTFNSNAFNAYLINSAGINANPVISNTGTSQSNLSGKFYETAGYLKGSPNAKKLACAVTGMGLVEIFDFDNSNGMVSNPISIKFPDKDFIPYGISFSPNSRLLYVSANDSMGNNSLYQYDLGTGIPANILASKVSIPMGVEAHDAPGALQLGPDSKIYFTTDAGFYMSVITNPDMLGAACDLRVDSISIYEGAYGAAAEAGLPNFIDTRLPAIGSAYNTALCNFLKDTLQANQGSQYYWTTGDTTQKVVVTTYGDYPVSYLNSNGCKETDTFRVVQTQAPLINILHDTTVCSNKPVSLSIYATDTNVTSYQWNDGFNQPVHTISNPGNYWVDYTFTNFCVSRDSFTFNIDSVPAINLGKDTILCNPLTLKANADEQYNWSNGATTQQITVNNSGVYSVIITSPQGCKNSDTINVTINIPPSIKVLKDTTECGIMYNSYTVNAFYPNTNLYTWNDGFSGPVHAINNVGSYWIQYNLNNTCVVKDSFNVYLYPYPTLSLGPDTTFCSGNLPLNAYNTNCTYTWNTSQKTPSIIATVPNTYWVIVNHGGCMSSDTIIIHPDLKQLNFVLPNIVTPNNDNVNDYIDFGTNGFSALQLEIYNRWGRKVFESSSPSCTWKPTEDDGTYFYTAQYIIDCGRETKSKSLKGFITVVR
jgi:hypothetical protein